MVEVEGRDLEIVDQFCYLDERITCESGAREEVKARIKTAWTKWRELSSLLVNRSIPRKSRERIYSACLRLVMIH